jgi:excisionase family DNA binding protein
MMASTRSSKVMTTTEVAKMVNVGSATVSKWIDKGMLKGFRVPGSNHRRVLRTDLGGVHEGQHPVPDVFFGLAFGNEFHVGADDGPRSADGVADEGEVGMSGHVQPGTGSRMAAAPATKFFRNPSVKS